MKDERKEGRKEGSLRKEIEGRKEVEGRKIGRKLNEGRTEVGRKK